MHLARNWKYSRTESSFSPISNSFKYAWHSITLPLHEARKRYTKGSHLTAPLAKSWITFHCAGNALATAVIVDHPYQVKGAKLWWPADELLSRGWRCLCYKTHLSSAWPINRTYNRLFTRAHLRPALVRYTNLISLTIFTEQELSRYSSLENRQHPLRITREIPSFPIYRSVFAIFYLNPVRYKHHRDKEDPCFPSTFKRYKFYVHPASTCSDSAISRLTAVTESQWRNVLWSESKGDSNECFNYSG